MKMISLKSLCGEFCTERTHPKMHDLRKIIIGAIDNNKVIQIEREGVRILSLSFVDALIPPILLERSEDQFHSFIKFTPPLENSYQDRIQKGVMLRLINRLQALTPAHTMPLEANKKPEPLETPSQELVEEINKMKTIVSYAKLREVIPVPTTYIDSIQNNFSDENARSILSALFHVLEKLLT